MENLLLVVLFFLPIIGVFSGLSVALTVSLFAVNCLFLLRKKIQFDFKNYKIEIAFVAWLLMSSLWSLNSLNSFLSGVKFAIGFFIGLILIKNISKIEIPISKINKIIITSFFISVIAFFWEYLTAGNISLLFREITQKNESHIFFLHNLDRGVGLLAMLSWVVINIFLQQQRQILAIFIYILSFSVLLLSDNLAASVGYVLAALMFILTKFKIFRNPKLLCFLLILGSVSMIIFAFKVNALQIAKDNQILPLSAKHRLFIWSFVAENSVNQPVLGIGFNSSKIFPVKDAQIIHLFGHPLHPLPLHPHNNIVQVYFELGIIGLILYLSLLCKYILIIGENYEILTTNRHINKIGVFYACFTVYFIVSMISYNMWQSWFVAAAIWIVTLFKLVDYERVCKPTK